MLRQGVDTQIHHQLGVIQNDPGDLFFGAGKVVGAFPQPQQGIAHGYPAFQSKTVLIILPFLPWKGHSLSSQIIQMAFVQNEYFKIRKNILISSNPPEKGFLDQGKKQSFFICTFS